MMCYEGPIDSGGVHLPACSAARNEISTPLDASFQSAALASSLCHKSNLGGGGALIGLSAFPPPPPLSRRPMPLSTKGLIAFEVLDSLLKTRRMFVLFCKAGDRKCGRKLHLTINSTGSFLFLFSLLFLTVKKKNISPSSGRFLLGSAGIEIQYGLVISKPILIVFQPCAHHEYSNLLQRAACVWSCLSRCGKDILMSLARRKMKRRTGGGGKVCEGARRSKV